MTLDFNSAKEIGGWIAAAYLGFHAYKQTGKTKKAEKKAEEAVAINSPSADDIIKKDAELASLYKDRAEEFLAALKEEKINHQATRDYHHEAANKAQSLTLKLTEENASLKAQTNLSPLIQLIENNSKQTEQVLATLSKMQQALDLLLHRLPPDPVI